MPEQAEKKRRINVILLYLLAAATLLLALWRVLNEVVIGFSIPVAALERYGEAELGFDGMELTDSLEEGSIRAYLYESEDGQAAATAFTKGMTGYKLAAWLEPGTGARELQVAGTEERAVIAVRPGAALEVTGSQQESWFGIVIINLILCGIAVITARQKQREGTKKAAEEKEKKEE